MMLLRIAGDALRRPWPAGTRWGGPRLALLLLFASFASGAALAAELTHHVALFPPASDWREHDRQGLVRVVNRSDRSGEVRMDAFDDDGNNHGPLTLTVGPRESVQFNSGDLERGNSAKGLAGATGTGLSHWRLELSSDELDLDVLAYVRSRSGALAAMHDVPPVTTFGASVDIGTFNPGSNTARQSLLRLTNPTAATATVLVWGYDDAGVRSGFVRTSLPPGASRTLTAQELEAGAAGLQGSLGDGAGKWRLTVSSTVAVRAAGILRVTATGLLTNLSTASTAEPGAVRRVPLLPSASDAIRQGFVRVVNRSTSDVETRIDVLDDDGIGYGPLMLALGAGRSVQFNAADLENGNPAKGLSGAAGPGVGDWRLELSGANVDVFAYVRMDDGFLSALHDVAPVEGTVRHVPTFNPGSNDDRRSLLRLTNLSGETADVVVRGVDDAGAPGESGVALRLAAGASRTLTARELEQGAPGLEGALGDGAGKWRLAVESSADIRAMSLLSARSTGHLTNLSTSPLAAPALTRDETTVDVADATLREALEGHLNKDAGTPITRAEMAALVSVVRADEDIADLTGLDFATGLRSLLLGGNRIADLGPLAELRSLSYADLRRNEIVDLAPLAELPKLRYLSLNGNQVEDLAPLAGLTKLILLHVERNRVSDVAPLVGLTDLRWLDLAENRIGNIGALAGLTELGWLDLDNNELVDITPLANLTKLRSWLDLDHNQIVDLSPLAGLTRLEGLDFHHNQVVDITPLAGLTRLTFLNAKENQIADLAALAGLADLRTVYLGRNQIADVASLAGLADLETLSVHENRIVDVAPLAGLTGLSTLHVQDNEIVDIGPLVENSGIGEGDEIRLERNPLSEASCGEHVPALVARGADVNDDCGG